MKKILYIGADPEIAAVMLRVINANPEWNGTLAAADEAEALVAREPFDVVLLGCGLDAETEAALQQQLIAVRPGLKVVLHYGGGSGLLKAEIETALRQH
jgi:DNA-binding NtrC family response regulator